MLQKWKSLPFESDCSSNLRQIIEQLFQIVMDHLAQFQVKQIVWAKVEDFPWWPGRIITTKKHRDQTIYRIHFFGDPTYCYLRHSFLLDFQTGLISLQEQFSADLKLQKPISLAKAAFQKQLNACKIRQSHNTNFEEQPQNTNDIFEESKTETKPLIENVRKSPFNEQKKTHLQAQPFIQFFIPKINTSNVIQVLESPTLKQLKCRKGSHNRKQILTLKLSLKQKLLEKYNLDKIEQKQQAKPIRVYKRKIIVRKNEKPKKVERKNTNLFMVRKIRRILEQYLTSSISKNYAVKIGEKILEWYDQDTSMYRKCFRNMVFWLNTTKCSNIESFQTIIMDSSPNKRQDCEQKSKFTQISVEKESISAV